MIERGRRRAKPGWVVAIVLVVVVGFAWVRASNGPWGWADHQSRYTAGFFAPVPRLHACVQVELSGALNYERSSGSRGRDRHFRNLVVTDPTMKVRFYESCRGSDLIKLSRVRFAQTWSATDGRVLDRRASMFAGPLRGASQYSSGAPIEVPGVTGRGGICLVVTPSFSARRAQVDSVQKFHKITFCGH